MATTKIEWADATWNPITGCTPISEACDHCYAKRMATRLAGRYGYPKDDPFRVTQHSEAFFSLRKLKKPKRIFVCSMGDLFHEDLRGLSGDGLEWSAVYSIFAEMIANPQHIFMVLTKRPANAMSFFKQWIEPGKDKIDHIWLGVTAENQARADERIPILLQIPAAVRFVSIEPMLGPVVLPECTGNHHCKLDGIDGHSDRPLGGIDWVICGGETGPGARPMHPDWVRGLRDQCVAAGVPFFFKRWGEYVESVPFDEESAKHHLMTDDGTFYRVGKKASGRLLDGREWNEFPATRP